MTCSYNFVSVLDNSDIIPTTVSKILLFETKAIMVPRTTHVFFLCLVVTAAISSGKPQNSSAKQTETAKSQARQSLVVNNNCGLANNEREMMAHIKAKVDYIAAQSVRGKFLQCPKIRRLSSVCQSC